MDQHCVRSDERRVVVTGLGVVSPYGRGCEVYWQGLAQGQCMIGPLTLFPTEGFRSRLAGELPAATVRALGTAQQSRATRFLLAAAQEAVGNASLDPVALSTAAVSIGGGGGGMVGAGDWYWGRSSQPRGAHRHVSGLSSMLSAALSAVL